jgi:hypothetical protein
LGVENSEENLQLLCREHNVIAAQCILGEGVMAKFIKPNAENIKMSKI